MELKNCLLRFFAIMVVALLSVGFVSCGGDDNEDDNMPSEQAQIDTRPITLFTVSTATIEGADTIKSNDEFVAYAEKDVIHGFHVGETTVTVNDKAYINVTVKPQYHLYDDPICDWGCDMAFVKANQKQGKFVSAKSDNTKIFYENAGAASYLMYYFENGVLTGAGAIVSTNHTTQYAKFLGERYMMTTMYEGKDTYFVGIDALTVEEANVLVMLEVYNTEYLICVYMPADKFSSRSYAESAIEKIRKSIDQLGL